MFVGQLHKELLDLTYLLGGPIQFYSIPIYQFTSQAAIPNEQVRRFAEPPHIEKWDGKQ